MASDDHDKQPPEPRESNLLTDRRAARAAWHEALAEEGDTAAALRRIAHQMGHPASAGDIDYAEMLLDSGHDIVVVIERAMG